jgi:thiamine-monophosphate kinase
LQNLPREFDLIARHFAPLAGDGALGLRDDGAVLAPPAGRELVLTADAIVEGVHFLPGDPPDTVAQKLLRVNLSDLAAMGAAPLGYLLTVSVPRDTSPAWFAAFAQGLARDQAEFGLRLLGGDTTSTPGPISLTATLIGHVAPGQALRRDGARPGDLLWVTGTIGDAALGLKALRGEVQDATGILAERYRVPTPRMGLALHGIVSACMDISDGLLQDAMHVCRASGCTLNIDFARIPLSDAARTVMDPEAVLSGGDDYELLLAVPGAQLGDFLRATASVPVARIGEFRPGEPDVVVTNAPASFRPGASGWSHF